MTDRLVVVGLAVVAFAVVVSGSAAAQSAGPSPTCGDSSDTGILYETESGLSVVDDADSPPPANSTIRDNTTARVGNVTLSADGNASVRVENDTAPACLAAVNATETPLTVAVDGVGTVVVDGSADRLAVGSRDGTLALAYDASESLTVTVENVAFETGTDVAATDDSGETLATGTVSDSGTLPLSLPLGTATVALAADQSNGTGGAVDGDDDDGDDSDDGGGNESDRSDNVSSESDANTASLATDETEPADEPIKMGGDITGLGIVVAVVVLLGGLTPVYRQWR